MKPKRLILFTSVILNICVGLTSCSSDCLTCSGITADQEICESDFQESADFNQYVAEYKEKGGICEEPL
ncbi:MAG: hypothetical protein ACI9FU_001533 [Granulosicoccus sp.]|jgi:hypothetical protein